jgi:HIV-1 Vpr-binding protein
VPALDQCRIKFNEPGDVIYGAMFEEESSEDESEHRSPFGSSFRTFDSVDYTNIATIDVKKSIYDLAVGPSETYIAVIENQNRSGDVLANSESVCRLYEVGRSKEEDDEEADDDEEEEEDDMGDDDSEDDNLENTDDLNPDDSDEDEDGSDMEGLALSISDSDIDDDDDSSSSADDDEEDEWEDFNEEDADNEDAANAGPGAANGSDSEL